MQINGSTYAPRAFKKAFLLTLSPHLQKHNNNNHCSRVTVCLPKIFPTIHQILTMRWLSNICQTTVSGWGLCDDDEIVSAEVGPEEWHDRRWLGWALCTFSSNGFRKWSTIQFAWRWNSHSVVRNERVQARYHESWLAEDTVIYTIRLWWVTVYLCQVKAWSVSTVTTAAGL